MAAGLTEGVVATEGAGAADESAGSSRSARKGNEMGTLKDTRDKNNWYHFNSM